MPPSIFHPPEDLKNDNKQAHQELHGQERQGHQGKFNSPVQFAYLKPPIEILSDFF